MSAVAEKKATVAKIRNRILGPDTIGGMIDRLQELRNEKRQHEAAVKLIEEDFNVLHDKLLERLDKEGADKATGKLASVSISAVVTGNLEDWDTFCAYVKKTGHFHLFQRRLSDPACRELFDTKGKIPGVSPFTKRRLNLRVLTS